MGRGRYTPSEPSGDVAAPRPENLEEFRVPLRLFAARRLRTREAAEDVSQEALRVALEALNAGRIESVEALAGFLFRTAVHVCMHRNRSDFRERRALERAMPASDSESALGENPLGSLISSERQASVREALGRLGGEERRLLELTYRDELSSEEIGRQLGATPGAVRVRRHRALRRLAALLGVTTPPVREFKE